MGEITLHVAQTVNKEELQHSVPQKHGFFFRYVIVNRLRKCDNRDNNNNTNNNTISEYFYAAQHAQGPLQREQSDVTEIHKHKQQKG